jgi:hypothetical protein
MWLTWNARRQWRVRYSDCHSFPPGATGTNKQTHSFQMVSLLELAQVTEEGVRFLSPHDRTPMYAAFHRIIR